VGTRQKVVGDVAVSYLIFRARPDAVDLGGCYDETGTVYISEVLVQHDERYADLVALHEHVGIRHKRAGRNHTYAHRRGLVVELLTAQGILGSSDLEPYVRWRINAHPDAKVPDRSDVVTQLVTLVAVERPKRTQLLRVITQLGL
jgi:hypothetical protein